MAKKISASQVIVYRDACKACGICIGFCPTKILESDELGYPVVARLKDCIACDLCTARCPDLAIEVIHETSEKDGSQDDDDKGKK